MKRVIGRQFRCHSVQRDERKMKRNSIFITSILARIVCCIEPKIVLAFLIAMVVVNLSFNNVENYFQVLTEDNSAAAETSIAAATNNDYAAITKINASASSKGEAVTGDLSNLTQNNGLSYLSLNASNFVDVKSNSSLQLKIFTVSVWFRTYATFPPGSYHHFIINKGGLGLETTGHNMNYGIWMDDKERIQAGFETTKGENYFLITPISYNDSRWHNAVLSYNGSLMNLYMDGSTVIAKRQTSVEPDSLGSQPVSIGVNSLSINGFFLGDVDGAQIWNRALSSEDIETGYNNITSNGSNTGYYYDHHFYNAAGQVFSYPNHKK